MTRPWCARRSNGKTDQAGANVKQAGEKVKDALKSLSRLSLTGGRDASGVTPSPPLACPTVQAWVWGGHP
jgi:hypothetical protein